MTKSDEVTIERFVWAKRDMFCSVCGRAIGVYAFRHSGKCQKCNMVEANKKRKEALNRVGS